MSFVKRRRRDNPTTTMDDARKIDDALLRAFCAVQALCAGAIGIAYPAVLYALATYWTTSRAPTKPRECAPATRPRIC